MHLATFFFFSEDAALTRFFFVFHRPLGALTRSKTGQFESDPLRQLTLINSFPETNLAASQTLLIHVPLVGGKG